ncbi:MAG: SxtJ family membrane protein [Stappiaceae bacterium]
MIEDYKREDDHKGSSNRGFGLIVGGIFAAIGLVRVYLHWGQDFGILTTIFLGIGGVLMALGLVAPSTLTVPNRLWMKLGLLMAKIINPLVLGLVYLVVITPIGLLLQLFGKDPMGRNMKNDSDSYWIDRTPPGPEPKSMVDQF